MRLGYFTMPVHPMGRDWSQTLQEDREAIILADKLGFYDAFVGEHLTDACENITNSMIFQATLIHDTKNIKLATGTTNLAQMHPVVIAVNAAMFDHLSQGRFVMGISAGALTSDSEAIGILDEDRNKIFAEAIDVILAVWERNPPYDIDFPDNRFKVGFARTAALALGVGILAKPFQKPRPEIVGTVVAPFSPGDHSFTFAHFPLAMAAAYATIQVLEEENLLEERKTWISDAWTLAGAGRVERFAYAHKQTYLKEREYMLGYLALFL